MIPNEHMDTFNSFFNLNYGYTYSFVEYTNPPKIEFQMMIVKNEWTKRCWLLKITKEIKFGSEIYDLNGGHINILDFDRVLNMYLSNKTNNYRFLSIEEFLNEFKFDLGNFINCLRIIDQTNEPFNQKFYKRL